MKKLNTTHRGPGRPATGLSPQIVVRLPAPLLRRVESIAERNFCARGVVLRMLIARALETVSAEM
jgi:hypothetical protein